tara:strand:+ start:315 stop:479 length:165 start_codon:yes stop_codon:yes gene_type:complete
MEDSVDYKFFKMKEGFSFDQMSESDLKYYKKVKMNEGEKMAVVNSESKLVYVEE